MGFILYIFTAQKTDISLTNEALPIADTPSEALFTGFHDKPSTFTTVALHRK
jgi:hypothetical protein